MRNHGCKAVAVALLGLVSTSAPVLAVHQSHYALAQHAIDGYVVPRLAAFETASKMLAGSVASHCGTPGDAGRAEVIARFRDALMAWAEAAVVRTGPAARDGRAQKIAFWPDPRGAVDRQLRQALARHQPEIAAPDTLRAESAAVQGFPALEYIIADKSVDFAGADDEGRYRCRVAAAIAGNIVALSHEIHDGWTRPGGWRDHMLRPGSDNADYPSAAASATDLYKSLTTSLQAIIEAELQPLAGTDKDKKSRSAGGPYKRLGLSRDYLLAEIKGCRGLYDAAKLASYLDADDPEDKKLLDLIDTAFSVTAREIASDAWAKAAGAKPGDDGFKPARVAVSMLGAARRIIATKVADRAEISLGFNELDGD